MIIVLYNGGNLFHSSQRQSWIRFMPQMPCVILTMNGEMSVNFRPASVVQMGTWLSMEPFERLGQCLWCVMLKENIVSTLKVVDTSSSARRAWLCLSEHDCASVSMNNLSNLRERVITRGSSTCRIEVLQSIGSWSRRTQVPSPLLRRWIAIKRGRCLLMSWIFSPVFGRWISIVM